MPFSPGMQENIESDEKAAPASTLGKRTRREVDSDTEDDDTEDDEISAAAPTEREVILAGPSGHLDSLTRPFLRLELVRANDYTGDISQTLRLLCALVYFRRHDVLREHIQELFHKPPGLFFAAAWMEAACKSDIEMLRSKTLTYIRDLVKDIYTSKLAKKNSLDITRLPVADRKARIWVPLWRRRGLELVKGMYRNIDQVIDFDIIMRPPTNLTKGLREKLQKWRTYLMLCFCLAAEASCKLELLPEVRPKAIIRAPLAETVSNHWRRLPYENYVHVPDLTDLPVFERMYCWDHSWERRKIVCPSGHSFLDTTDMVG